MKIVQMAMLALATLSAELPAPDPMDYRTDPRAGETGGRGPVTPLLPDQEDSVDGSDGLPVGARIVDVTPDYIKKNQDCVERVGDWGATNGFGVYWRDIGGGKWKRATKQGLTSEVVRRVFEFPSEVHLVWVATDMGLTLCREGGKGELLAVTRWTTQEGLPGDEITVLARDDQKGIWIGTRSGLVEIPDPEGSPYIMKTYTPDHGLPAYHITELKLANICPGDKARATPQLWIGTVGGLCVLDLARREFARPITGENKTLTDAWVRGIEVSEVKIEKSRNHKNLEAERTTVTVSGMGSNRTGETAAPQTLQVESFAGKERVWEHTVVEPIQRPMIFGTPTTKLSHKVQAIGFAFGTVLYGTPAEGIMVDQRGGKLVRACRSQLLNGIFPYDQWVWAHQAARGPAVPGLSVRASNGATVPVLEMPEDESLEMPKFPNLFSFGPDGAVMPSDERDMKGPLDDAGRRRVTVPAMKWPPLDGPPLPEHGGEYLEKSPISRLLSPRVPLPGNDVRAFLTEPGGSLWVATTSGITRISEPGVKADRPDPAHGPVREIVGFGQREQMVFDTWVGAHRIPTDNVYLLAHDPRRSILWAVGIKSEDAFTDATRGRLAPARAVHTLMRCERDVWTRVALEAGDGVDTAIEGILVHALTVSPIDGRVFLGTNKGLLVYDGARVSRYRFSTTIVNPTAFDHFKAKPQRVDDVEVWAVSQDSRGALWVGTNFGLWRDNGSCIKIYSTMNGLAHDDVTWVHATRNEVYILSRPSMALDWGNVQRLTYLPEYTETFPRRLVKVTEHLSGPEGKIRHASAAQGLITLYRPLTQELGTYSAP